nr:MAG TPA: hypothetical protein [Microviridae sp.]
MSNNTDLFASVVGDYLQGLTFHEALIVTDLFSWCPFKDSEGDVSLCHCSPHNEVRYAELSYVLRTLSDVASSLQFHFVYYDLQDEISFGIPLDIFRVGMSVDFYTRFSRFLAEYMKSSSYRE